MWTKLYRSPTFATKCLLIFQLSWANPANWLYGSIWASDPGRARSLYAYRGVRSQV